MPDAPSAAALPGVPRRDRGGRALLSPRWAAYFGASLTNCFETAASLCPGFLLVFLSCIWCRDVGMKPAVVLLKPPYVALLPARPERCPGQELLNFGAGIAGALWAVPAHAVLSFSLLLSNGSLFPHGNPVPALCGKLGNRISSCRTAQRASSGSLLGEVGLTHPAGGLWEKGSGGGGGGAGAAPVPGLRSCRGPCGTSGNANNCASSSSARRLWEQSLRLSKIKGGSRAMSLFLRVQGFPYQKESLHVDYGFFGPFLLKTQ